MFDFLPKTSESDDQSLVIYQYRLIHAEDEKADKAQHDISPLKQLQDVLPPWSRPGMSE